MEAVNGHAARQDLGEVLTGEPLAAGYRPTLPLWSLWTADGTPQLYLLRDIELMLTHPIVRVVLDYFKGGIAGVEFEIDCMNPEAYDFIEDQCERWWDRGVPLVQGGYDYGWIGLEAHYTDNEGMLKWDSLLQFSPRDTFVLTQAKKPIGVRVKNVDKKGYVDLWMATEDVPAKGIWYAHTPRYTWLYGQSQLIGAWRPWRRLAWKDGAEMVTDMGVYRMAYTGPVMRYPEEDIQMQTNAVATTLDSQGRPRKYARDIARMMAEQMKAGAAIGLPSTMYPPEMGGGEKWGMEWPSHVLNVDPLINYCKWLQDQISYGIGVPPELLQASEVGSGYSGRAIPLESFLSIQQRIADSLLHLFLREILRPLVRWNWGSQLQFDVQVKSLLETKRQQQTGGEGGTPGKFGTQTKKTRHISTRGPLTHGLAPPTSAPKPPGVSRVASSGGGARGFSLTDEQRDEVKKLAQSLLDDAA